MNLSGAIERANARKAEILRLIKIKPMTANDLMATLSPNEPTLTLAALRANLYVMICAEQIHKEFPKGMKHLAIYMAGKRGEYVAPILEGFGMPRRMSCDDSRNVEIMRSQQLRKITHTIMGSSLAYD